MKKEMRLICSELVSKIFPQKHQTRVVGNALYVCNTLYKHMIHYGLENCLAVENLHTRKQIHAGEMKQVCTM